MEDNVKNGRHPLDTQGQKGAISVFIGNLPFSVRVWAQREGAVVWEDRSPLDPSSRGGRSGVRKMAYLFTHTHRPQPNKQMNEDNIKEMFGQYGGVVAVTIVKDQLNRSKGFGFVEVRVYTDRVGFRARCFAGGRRALRIGA